jgi:hypothetical protein
VIFYDDIISCQEEWWYAQNCITEELVITARNLPISNKKWGNLIQYIFNYNIFYITVFADNTEDRSFIKKILIQLLIQLSHLTIIIPVEYFDDIF